MASTLTQQNAPSWLQWATNFDAARKLFLDSWHALKSRRDWVAQYQPQLLKQHDAIMQRFLDQVPAIKEIETFRHNLDQGFKMIGAGIQNALNFTGIPAGVSWLQRTFNLNGIEDSNRLGAIQIIPLAITLGAAGATLAAMAALANDGFKHVTRVDAIKMAMERGATAGEASALVNDALGKSGDGQFLGLPIREAMLAAVLLVLGPPIVKAISESRK
jgi:hypothetical protein